MFLEMIGSKLIVLVCGIALASGGVIKSDNIELERFLRHTIYGTYQEPITPELEQLQNYEERSGKFEGDIVLTDKQIEALLTDMESGSRNSILNTNRHWTAKTVYYSIRSGDFNAAQIAAIEKGVEELEQRTCLIFKKRVNEPNYVEVTGQTAGCFSSVGMIGGRQQLNLSPNTPGSGCFRHGTIVHEFLHAIGFYHMQSTHDRDDYVRIVWDKIQPGTEHNFNKYSTSQVTNFNEVYDYGSVLHYSEYGFSIDGSKTIVPLKPTDETIGQRIKMSDSDVRRVNIMYKCNAFL